MSIDWKKAEKYPQKAYKVEGRFLLDLRARINGLKRELGLIQDEIEEIKSSI